MTPDPSDPLKNQQASSRLRVFVAVLLAAATLLTWLFFEADSVEPELHQQFLQQFRTVRENDAEIDAEVLAARLHLVNNYDALTRYAQRIKEGSVRLQTPPDYLPLQMVESYQVKADQFATLTETKLDRIDQFKRQNAIYRNAQAYLTASLEGRFDDGVRLDKATPFALYVREVLLYLTDTTAIRAQAVEQAEADLLDRVETEQALSEADQAIAHAGVAIDALARIRQLNQEIHQLPLAQVHAELLEIYLAGYRIAVHQADRFRTLLYVAALLLTAYLASVFVSLEQTRRSLVAANEEISERYLAQRNAERRLRLHGTAFESSHEGISLTDGEGKIIDVNPAFTRITGFERNEVLGRNPRVLKSGRHDEAFYQAMWKSITETGRWRGEIWNRNKFGEVYPELLSISSVHDSQGKLTNYVAIFSDISRLKEQEKQLQQMAFYDPLTDLPNRVLMLDRLVQAMGQCKRSGTQLAICYLDLDGFKPINDTFGHHVGDKVLIEIAARLSSDLRGGDTVSRLGGDEFVILYSGIGADDDCDRLMKRLLNTISQPLRIEGSDLELSASVGVTLYPEDESDTETLLRHADQAMYLAKQAGKNTYHRFDLTEDKETRTRHTRIARIEEALSNEEFVLYYQPKVMLRSGRVMGVEALLRWEDPDRGLVPPLEFLPLIEDDPLSVRVGEWVIKTAVDQVNAWHRSGLELPVSINVSGLQLQSSDFVEFLKTTLSRYPDLPPSRVQIEVLESAALGDIGQVSKIIADCNELGISFALDDFGTGYSSLTYLKRLPATTLKIDQSFVRDMLKDPENLAIVQGTLGLANAFQRFAVAEGVETVDDGRMLIQLGCEAAQGYGIARPMPADKVAEWVSSWKGYPEWTELQDLQWDDADFPLFSIEVEHRRWISLVINALNEGMEIPHAVVADPTRCNFGQWYYSRGQAHYGKDAIYRQIEQPHNAVHAVATRIETHHLAGETKQAKALIPELLEHRDRLLAAVKKMQMKVARRERVIDQG